MRSCACHERVCLNVPQIKSHDRIVRLLSTDARWRRAMRTARRWHQARPG
uniref:Uncharacterized protein n=1 Tax=Arundo donax TaxID=35708 RepID=A0A0A8ZGC3_ARUDO